MTNPILLAAARGARIETYHYKNEWFETDVIVMGIAKEISEYRIHPNDEHLRFGPIGTALREAAKTPPADPWRHDNNYVLAAIEDGVWGDGHTLGDYQEADRLHRSLFLLILSEALTDEGL